MPACPRSKLSVDDLKAARSAARRRGERHARYAIGEMALGRAIRRRWNDRFTDVEKWGCWQDVGQVDEIRISVIKNLHDPLVVAGEASDTSVYVLMTERDAPTFEFLGWVLAHNAKQDHFLDEASGTYHVPVAELESCWLLAKRTKRAGGRRLNANDPADDFAGHGPFPYMLDSDDGRHPSEFGQTPMPSQTRFSLPCRRCQRLVTPEMLAVSARETGLIHGNPDDCGFYSDKPVPP